MILIREHLPAFINNTSYIHSSVGITDTPYQLTGLLTVVITVELAPYGRTYKALNSCK